MNATADKPKKRSGKSLGVYIDPALMSSLQQFVTEFRPRTDKTAVVSAALEEYLKARGFGPPGKDD